MSDNRTLEGQTALVTGAGSGIGAAIAKAMAAAGANVAVNYPSEEEAANLIVREISEEGGTAIAVKADVSNEEQVLSMFKTVSDAYGTVDVLVSNAGIQKDSGFVDMTLKHWQAVL